MKKKKRQSRFQEIWRRLKKNRLAMVGLVIIAFLLFCALFPSVLASYGYDDQVLSRANIAPCQEFPFGTDNLGRDVFSRVIYGAGISLRIAIISVGIAAVTGIFLGALAGYYGGMVENVIMRSIDILLAIPSILLAISIVAALGTSLVNLMIAVGIGSTPRFARIVHSSILSVKDQEYIEAARCIGVSNSKIILTHVLPNCAAPIIVQATMGLASAILSASSLSFIGLGVEPPMPEWGTMLSAGRQYIRDYWWMVTFPGLAIMMTIFSFNLLGDGLRDALDPKLKV